MVECIWSCFVRNAVAVSAIASVVAICVTLWSLHTNRKVELARLRPVVNASIECIDNVYCLVIRNVGLSAAHEVVVSTSPLITIQLHPAVAGKIPFLEHPIPTLMPSASLQTGFVAGYNALKKMSREMRFAIGMEYYDDDGKKYTSSQKIDVRLVADAAVLPVKSDGVLIAKAIKDGTAVIANKVDDVCKHR